jgi:hypothetical protein
LRQAGKDGKQVVGRQGRGAVLCDACNKRIRRDEHELRLSDFTTGQRIGVYHAPRCQEAAVKYLVQGGAVLNMTYAHPDRCGSNQECCDAGLSAVLA